MTEMDDVVCIELFYTLLLDVNIFAHFSFACFGPTGHKTGIGKSCDITDTAV